MQCASGGAGKQLHGMEKSGNADRPRQGVNELLELLGLSKVADQPIGDASTGGLSGGERQRVALAACMAAAADILCLDEVRMPASAAAQQHCAYLVNHVYGVFVFCICHPASLGSRFELG
jgi:ABC-type Mn2+/Zn2+ transport system ATPase subunit